MHSPSSSLQISPKAAAFRLSAKAVNFLPHSIFVALWTLSNLRKQPGAAAKYSKFPYSRVDRTKALKSTARSEQPSNF
jgi:hypothetical protein